MTAQLLRYAAVGAVNTAVSLCVFVLLVDAAVPPAPASLVAFAAGAVNGYVLNRRWTFAARDCARARIMYVLVQAAGATATAAAVSLAAPYAIVLPLVTAASFAVNRAVTFAEGGAARAAPPSR